MDGEWVSSIFLFILFPQNYDHWRQEILHTPSPLRRCSFQAMLDAAQKKGTRGQKEYQRRLVWELCMEEEG